MSTIEKIVESKEHRRQRLAHLSVPEKVRIIVELQKRRAPILRMRGKKQFVWQLEAEPDKLDTETENHEGAG